MNLSTSSSKDEWKVILVVAIVLIACEFAVRQKVRRHVDDRHIAELPHIARALQSVPRPRVLFLGNSLTKAGIRTDSFQEELTSTGMGVGTPVKVHPDDTTIQHWYYLFQRYFGRSNPSKAPEFVIITFCLDHLSDQVATRNRRLAKLVVGPEQILEVLLVDLSSVDERAGFLMAHVFRSVSDQGEIKNGVLKRLIPHYESELQRLNSVRRAYEEASPATGQSANPIFTYRRLERLIDLLHEQKSQGVFSLIPLPYEQSLDPELTKTIESNGMILLDLRDLASLTQGHYPDGYHMDPVAADIYSRALAEALAVRVSDTSLLTESTAPEAEAAKCPPNGLREGIDDRRGR